MAEEKKDETIEVEGNREQSAATEKSENTDAKAPLKDAKPSEPDWKDQYARLLADFDNYKKRAARDREDTYRYAEADILKDVLPTVDNLALAIANAKATSGALGDRALPRDKNDGHAGTRAPTGAKDTAEDPFVKGVRLVYDTLLKTLKEHGAEPFDSLDQELDPEKMEAIATLPSAEIAEGKVSTEVKKGWMLKGKLLRAAQVVVSSGAPAETKA